MIQSYLRAALRSLTRNKVNTLIHLMGLSVGLAAFILITAYVHFENSYDRMFPDQERIYRVESSFYKGAQMTDDWATSTNGYALAIKDNFPQVESFTRINWNDGERVVRYNDVKFREPHVCFADTNFLSFFSYQLLKGDRTTALKDVNTVVLSATDAKKYFGNTDPMGKFLDITTIGSSYHCMVTGVFQDPPPNSTVHFNMLISWATTPEWMKTTWYLHESYTFLKLRPGADPHVLEAGFPALAEKYKNGPALKELKWAIRLIPLADIHLNRAKQYEIETKGNRLAVRFLGIMAFFVLLIAGVNYTNLSTARAMERAKEVGIRKVSGARPIQLAGQFLLESFLLHGLALCCALVWFGLAGLALSKSFDVTNPAVGIRVAWVFTLSAVLSGFYPALVLSRLKPVRVLKGRYAFSGSGAWLRKGLVTFQFAISLLLITGTLAVYRQLSFMNSQALGVNIEQTLVLKAPATTEDYAQKALALKNALLTIPGVSGVTGSGSVPGKEVGEFLANRRVGAPKEEERTYEMLKVDPDFISFYGLTVIAGKGLDRDSTGLVLNESAVRQFGFASPEAAIGQKVWLEVNNGRQNEVIGVIRDYHQQSLRQAYTPLILFMDPHYGWIPTNNYSVKISGGQINNVLTRIRGIWQDIFPASSLDYFFLNDYYDRQYREDRVFGQVFGLFSALAILIACMGLFGLTAYTVARRTKEIGVRKVLGASIVSVLRLLSWDSLQLILPAGLAALPLAAWLIGLWLRGYAFRASMPWWQFALPVAVLAVITLLTTGYLALQAARANPVKAIKEE